MGGLAVSFSIENKSLLHFASKILTIESNCNCNEILFKFVTAIVTKLLFRLVTVTFTQLLYK